MNKNINIFIVLIFVLPNSQCHHKQNPFKNSSKAVILNSSILICADESGLLMAGLSNWASSFLLISVFTWYWLRMIPAWYWLLAGTGYCLVLATGWNWLLSTAWSWYWLLPGTSTGYCLVLATV